MARPSGQKNKPGHNAGRKRKLIPNQSTITSFTARPSKRRTEASTSENLGHEFEDSNSNEIPRNPTSAPNTTPIINNEVPESC